ncbi:hypothetical protein TBLA_0B05820 [Henningerozyma blattae CBS 6284]|uniref:Conserved oligomeric Golgi complex subunit 5 n=1 Tax=Henningerozyma blattae (strain ATCC 34711 / CBS 6284 / DSM 70876 / NBRC 10599 / NRRL Y-10934 / UCD 77-7) TaxID=1071380 RepID=I2GZ56_HENB6|nr:hypothetical protein TBLA_0B05820 [Tetrapisispora blattae CBS 6284]CCH59408.1 hypothetical protein TBLA_0B05820 [Tetrapisispora blattae CBS 6284]
MASDFSDFDSFLEPNFDSIHFTNELLKITNTNENSLDIQTSIKKIHYDYNELDTNFDQLIKEHSKQIIAKIHYNKQLKSIIQSNLSDSINFLNLNYKRLQDDIIVPYEKAQKLQQVLSKLHQTIILLRDSLIYIHLVHRIHNLFQFIDNEKDLPLDVALQLSSLHYQIIICLNENKNLTPLKLIKNLNNTIVTPNKSKLLSYLSLQLSKECWNLSKLPLSLNKIVISNLSFALFNLSPHEFITTIQKIILTIVTPISQNLIKTINSIKNFPQEFTKCVKISNNIYQLETILADIKYKDSNLLLEYMNNPLRMAKPNLPKTIYWNTISTNFKKEFEISVNRGGPVGKSLMKNKEFIKETIKNLMVESTGDDDYKKNLNTMLKSISILQ